MTKMIFKQLINRWRSNIWIALELLVVFCVMWYIVDYFFVYSYNKSITSYRDTESTFLIEMNQLPDTHRNYVEEEDIPENKLLNFNRILNRIQQYPEVEKLCISFFNTYPGSPNGHMGGHVNPQDTTKNAVVNRIFFDPQWDYFQVFRHTTQDGAKGVSTQDFDWSNPQNVVLTRLTADKLFPGEPAVGKQMKITYRDAFFYIVGVIDDIKRYDYTRPMALAFFPLRLDEDNLGNAQICVRVNENISSDRFASDFKSTMTKELRIGNFYLSKVSSFKDINNKTTYRNGITNVIRTRAILMGFLLFSILLCLLGIFWYRVNSRREEIGIRRAMGANAGTVRRLFIREGILLLACILVPAMIIELQFVNLGLIETLGQSAETMGMYLPDKTIIRFLLTNLITCILLVGTIIISIWYPAVIASRIAPVDALRDE